MVKNQPANAGDATDMSSVPGSGRSPGEGNGNPSSIPAWKIPWTEDYGGLQSMRSQRVRHSLANKQQQCYIQKWLKEEILSSHHKEKIFSIALMLLLGRKVVTNLDSILKSRDITLPTKVRLVKTMIFPVVMYGCESWTVKKAECRRIDAFELWCWRRLSRVSWTARRSNQSILNEISPEYSLEGVMLKLKLQYFGHLMQRADSFEETLMLGRIEGRRRRGRQRMR